MFRMRFLLLTFVISSFTEVVGQDLSGTWKGSLILQGMHNDLPRISGMTWELLQLGDAIYGIVYFFPQDAHPGDPENAIYTWSGQLANKVITPFNFIQGRFVDGLGSSSVHLFQVVYKAGETAAFLEGKWYTQLEAIHTLERPNGYFKLTRSGFNISNPLWKQHENEMVREKGIRLLQ